MKKFIQDAAQAGVDGLLVLDLPPEESENYEATDGEADLCTIYLVAPTTPDERIELIVKRGTGFIYYVSREGVTGMQQKVSDTIARNDGENSCAHRLADCGRFWHFQSGTGPDRGGDGEAVVVGSAIVNQIAQEGKIGDLVERVAEFTTAFRSCESRVKDI